MFVQPLFLSARPSECEGAGTFPPGFNGCFPRGEVKELGFTSWAWERKAGGGGDGPGGGPEDQQDKKAPTLVIKHLLWPQVEEML